MADPIVTMSYNAQSLSPAPTFSYSTSLVYNNDLVIGYTYKITLNGYCIPKGDNTEPSNVANVFNEIMQIKNIFSSNGGVLSIWSDNKPLVYATDIRVLNVNFNESSNNWSKFAQYTVELECNHLHLGEDLTSQQANIIAGNDDPDFADNLHSPNIVNMENHKLKAFSENCTINVDDSIFNQLAVYVDYSPQPLGYTTFISNNYYSVSLTVSATGKHDVVIDNDGQKSSLPAFEHAKRFVHRRLMTQIARMSNSFGDFMRQGTLTTLDQLHSNTGTSLIGHGSPGFQLFNETLNFTVSESDGTFEASYNAIVKQNCPPTGAPYGCSNNTLHTITKNVTKTFVANEQTNQYNQEISISINGEITGLVPGYNIGTGFSNPLILDGNLSTGSFLIINPLVSRIDKQSQAIALFNSIFNYSKFDLTTNFKTALGITHQTLNINPATEIKPSKMNLTRNFLGGTISYSAEYNNTFNCPTNHFSVDISVEEPVPIIQEFIIPNNNENSISPSGFPIIQNLGTETAKKINVTINGNVGEDFNKCCLGQADDWNLLNFNAFSLGPFTLPSGLILPVISEDYVLTSKTKKITYPEGNFTISLAYTCATTCPIGYLAVCEPCEN